MALNPRSAEPASLKSLKARSAKAYSDNSGHDAITEEVYKYCLPMRRPSTTQGQADQRFDHIFDGTGPKAAFRFAGRLQSDFTPPFQKFFELKGGPLIEPGDQKKKIDEDLSQVSRVVTSQINGSNFDVASHEAYLDLFAGQLDMLMLETGVESNPTHYVAIPSVEVALRVDGYGRDAGKYWKRKFPIGDLESMWPNAVIDEKTRQRISKDQYEEVEV
ncbi:MAG: hypothetical protein GY761_04090, partial [Hyphomicrobiales bacterium]|nr:hypothetical protein [Hyphomicrobiales bacterium]